MRKRGGRKRALGTRAPMTIPQEANQRWSLDFVSDTLTDGRRFRILCVIDDFSRECLATRRRQLALRRAGGARARPDRRAPRLSLHDRLGQRHRTDLATPSWPGRRSDRSSGTTSRQASRCRTASWRASSAGCATNASTSSCSPDYRHARDIIEEWRIDYNTNRPHTSLDGLTPNEFANRSQKDHNVNRLSL